MRKNLNAIAIFALVAALFGCNPNDESQKLATPHATNGNDAGLSAIGAKQILGNPEYLAMSYGGYREATRDKVPTVDQLKEDMKIMSAMGVKLVRTYNTQQYAHAANLLEAIRQLRKEQSGFEMYVMLGAWIDCEGAWTATINHEAEDVKNNTAEINAAVELANAYPEVVKIIAVGNEAMVHWATSYFVRPAVIRKWVDHLQGLKSSGKLPSNIWITSSDNFASWGGGDDSYRTDELTALIKSVDFVSLHTYPFHDSHYDPDFWGAPKEDEGLSIVARADAAMVRARDRAISQFQETADYIDSLGIKKPIHIGETGWASIASSNYGSTGSQAADQYKAKLYYEAMREWSNQAGMSCFFFEAFDERWKDTANADGSENHFGLINIEGQAKYALWDKVDAGIFAGLTRDGRPITKTYDGDEAALLAAVLKTPSQSEMDSQVLSNVNKKRSAGEKVTEGIYLVLNESLVPNQSNDMTYPSAPLKANVWEGTCEMQTSSDGVIRISPGTGDWWGCALEIQTDDTGEDLSLFKSGRLHFEIRGDTKSPFAVGFQTGVYAAGTQTNNEVAFGPESKFQLSKDWKSYSIPLSEFDNRADLADVRGILHVRGEKSTDTKNIDIRKVHFSKD